MKVPDNTVHDSAVPIGQATGRTWGQAKGGQWQGKFYPTDKIGNGMLAHYDRILASLRNQPVQMFDIGVANGGSCMLWSDYFFDSGSRITGLDLRLPPRGSTDEWRKIALETCDQNDRKRLNELAERHGPFDVIVDDGSHRYTETRTCYQELFKFLKPGGYYVIEDWSVGYWKGQLGARYRGPHGETMVRLVADIIRDGPVSGLASCRVILSNFSLAFLEKASASPPVRTKVSFQCVAPGQDQWPITFSGTSRIGVSAILTLLKHGPLLVACSILLNRIWTNTRKDSRHGRMP